MFFVTLAAACIRRPAVGIGICILAASAISNLPPGSVRDAVGADSTLNGATEEVGTHGTLMREGTRVSERLATCRSSGERLLISFDEDSPPLAALENLTAQRILKAVMDDVGDDRWIVSGQVTEFQERNYLLLERVVRQPKTN